MVVREVAEIEPDSSSLVYYRVVAPCRLFLIIAVSPSFFTSIACSCVNKNNTCPSHTEQRSGPILEYGRWLRNVRFV
jgi:hypothetical protein